MAVTRMRGVRSVIRATAAPLMHGEIEELPNADSPGDGQQCANQQDGKVNAPRSRLIGKFSRVLKFDRRCPSRGTEDSSDDSDSRNSPTDGQASIPSGLSTSRLNACISFAPSAPSMARWSKLPVALITVAICNESLIQ